MTTTQAPGSVPPPPTRRSGSPPPRRRPSAGAVTAGVLTAATIVAAVAARPHHNAPQSSPPSTPGATTNAPAAEPATVAPTPTTARGGVTAGTATTDVPAPVASTTRPTAPEAVLAFRAWLPPSWTEQPAPDSATYAPADASRGVAVIISAVPVDPAVSADRRIAAAHQAWLARHKDAEQVGIVHTTLNGYASTDIWIHLTHSDFTNASVALHYIDISDHLYVIELTASAGADPVAMSEACQLIDTFTVEPTRG